MTTTLTQVFKPKLSIQSQRLLQYPPHLLPHLSRFQHLHLGSPAKNKRIQRIGWGNIEA